MWRAAVRPAKPAPTITTFALGIFFGCSFIRIYYRDSQNGCSDENFSRRTDRDSLGLEGPEPSGYDRLPPVLRLGSDRHRISVSGVWALGATAGDPEPLGRYGDGHDSGPRAGRPRVAGAARPSIAEDVRRQRGAGGQVPANPTWPSIHLTWQYVVWALIQEFILQSFFFTRCEELFGGTAAVWVAATLFAAAHLPSPILTTFTLLAGLFFCEMFRRYRSIYPIGIVHAALGLTIAVTVPDSLLHHMRVGIGYLRY